MSNLAQAWVWNFSRSKGLDRLVLLSIAYRYNEDKQMAWPAIGNIAKLCGVSVSTVKRDLANLKELGELEVIERPLEGGSNDSNCYKLPQAQKWIERVEKEGYEYRVKGGVLIEPQGFKEEDRGYPIEPQEGFPQNPKFFSTSNSIEEKEVLPLNMEERKAIPKPEKKVKLKGWKEKNLEHIVGRTVRVPIPERIAKKIPEGFVEFSRLFSYYAEVAAMTLPEYWDLPDEIAEQIGWENLESRLEVYLDRVDKVTGWTAKDFLMGGWRTVTGKEYEMKQLDGKR